MNQFKFEVVHQSRKSNARACKIYTPHGIIDTPCFVPVGTNAAVKAVDSAFVENFNLPLIFCNTYHLIIQPGTTVVEQAGGLHQFMNRNKPIITDSGGFQVFSLAYGSVYDELKSRGTKKLTNTVVKINEDGVVFRSYKDGALIKLTPESSVQAQKAFGADIIIPLDELPPYHTTYEKLNESLERTHRWEKRSLDEHRKNSKNQAMFAVIHGGIDHELRKKSVEYLAHLPFDGFCIGGSLGKNFDEMLCLLDNLMPHVPEYSPRHLLGIGEIKSIEPIITRGIDTFDSSYPTRCARHGLLFTNTGSVKLLNAKYKNNFEPIDAQCNCYTCKNYTAAYLHHLFKAHELSAYTLASIHNLAFMANRMVWYRQQILDDMV